MNCEVFQKLQENALLNKIRGRDEDDTSTVLQDIKESLQETVKMLKKMADEFGIEPDDIFDDKNISMPDFRNDPLYRLSHDFTMQTHDFLKNIDALANEHTREYFEDIMWHHTIVSAKTYRAIASASDDLMTDAVNSAAVAIKSLNICIMAFDYIFRRSPDISDGCKRLSAIASTLKKEIKLRFITDRFE
ncbi:MAG: hypothetical protein AB1478_04795 [Nitrospirota bacterium]